MQLCAAKVQATTSRRVLAPCDVALSLSTSASTACTAAFAANSVLLMVSPACSAQQQQLLGGHICPVWVLLVDRGALADVLASTQETTKKARSHCSLTCIRVSHSFRGPWSPVVLRFRYRPPAGQGPWICSAVFERWRRETPRKWAALRAGGRGWAGLVCLLLWSGGVRFG